MKVFIVIAALLVATAFCAVKATGTKHDCVEWKMVEHQLSSSTQFIDGAWEPMFATVYTRECARWK